MSYVKITGGRCNSKPGRLHITDKETCQAAATILDEADKTTGEEQTANDKPPGCYITFSTAAKPQFLKYNTDNTSTTLCSSSNQCICASTPDCTEEAGKVENSGPCVCGRTAAAKRCTAGLGLYCSKSINKCHATSTCDQRQGNALNSAPCQCGTTECTATTGLYCDCPNPLNLADSICRAVPHCTKTKGLLQNPASCLCSPSKECTSSTGLYCDTTANTCALVPYCTNANGTALNAGSCRCGSSTCTSAVGLFCDTSINKCSTVPTCTQANSENEIATNTAPCQCGTSNCTVSSGLHCYASLNTCAKSCTRTQGLVANSDQCKCGAQRCAAGLKGLYCDKENGPTSVCRDVPHCNNANGQTINAMACQCGTKKCTTNAGLFCSAHRNSCSLAPNCLHTKGNVVNAEDTCQCGTNTCTVSTGLFCENTTNVCRTVGYCTKTNSSEINKASCQCGQETCSAGQLYCDASKSVCSAMPSNNIKKCGRSSDRFTPPLQEPCQCGSSADPKDNTHCDFAGLYCDVTSKTAKCRKHPYCVQIDGTAPNERSCYCGKGGDDTAQLCTNITGLRCAIPNDGVDGSLSPGASVSLSTSDPNSNKQRCTLEPENWTLEIVLGVLGFLVFVAGGLFLYKYLTKDEDREATQEETTSYLSKFKQKAHLERAASVKRKLQQEPSLHVALNVIKKNEDDSRDRKKLRKKSQANTSVEL